MAVGDSALLGGMSYIAFGRETTAGTYNTCTAMLPCLSFSMVATKDNKILEQIEKSRTYSQRTGTMKKVAGDASFYFQPQLDACGFILQNAFIGTITSATATGETVGAGGNSAMDHTFNIGDSYQSFSSLCINSRRGPTTLGKVFEYSGVRVNEISFSAEVNDALKVSLGLVAYDATQTSNDVASALTQTNTSVLSFIDGRMSVEGTVGSLTSSSFWHIQSVEFGLANNLKSDNASGRIGSDVLTVLPPGMATFNLRAKMRFDTMTAWSAMMAGTKLAVQLDFQGPTMTSSVHRQKLRVNFPSVYIHSAPEPTIGGPNEILSTDVEFHVLRQSDTTTGFACQAILTNQKASWA